MWGCLLIFFLEIAALAVAIVLVATVCLLGCDPLVGIGVTVAPNLLATLIISIYFYVDARFPIRGKAQFPLPPPLPPLTTKSEEPDVARCPVCGRQVWSDVGTHISEFHQHSRA